MNEIKLRAWDEGNRVMHYDFQFISSGNKWNDWIIFISDKLTLEDDNTNPFKNLNPYFCHQLKKMQYTGIKDKNKVPIYEGDILKGGIYKVYVVEWESLSNHQNIGFNISYNASNFEIIGNIYENKELLDENRHTSI